MNPFNYGVKRLQNRFPIWVVKVKHVYKTEGLFKVIYKILRKTYLFILAAGNPHRLQNADYTRWMKNVEELYTNDEYTDKLKVYVGDKVKFSVIFPVWNKPIFLIKMALDSIESQIYSNYEICISDGSTKDVEETRKFLEDYQKENPDKVKLAYLSEECCKPGVINIIENTNNAISLSNGDYCVFMDCDDALSSNCLLELALAIKHNSKADFLYSDFDKISLEGKRFDPSFWPNWSPHTILSMMYTTHVTCYRTKLLNQVGNLREGTAGAQDWDLVLRIVEKTSEIVHIPKILYHWRLYSESTAMANSGAKDWAYDVHRKVLEDCIVRRKYNAVVEEGVLAGHWRVKFAIENNPKVSIIVCFRDKVDYLKTCVSSVLEKTSYNNFEVVLVNNQSKEPETIEYIESLKSNSKIRILDYDFPYHFGRMNNWASTQVRSEYVLFLNNDTEVINPEWLESMLEFAQLKEVGGVGAKLLYKDNRIQHAGIVVGITGSAAHAHRMIEGTSYGYNGWLIDPHDVAGNTAACLLINKAKFNEVGKFDESFDPGFQDVDFGLKLMEAGYYNVYTPYAQLYHYESITRFDRTHKVTLARDEEIALKLQAKWPKYLKSSYGMDPYYNVNLSYDHEDFRLKVYVDTPKWKYDTGLVVKLS